MGVMILSSVVLLLSGMLFGVVWRLAAIRAWGRLGWQRADDWRRWLPIVLGLLYLPYLLCMVWILRVMEHAWPGNKVLLYSLFVCTVPSVGLGTATGLAARSWLPACGCMLSAVGAPIAFFTFESGTHGPWYIRSEALAILLSVVVGSLAWLVPVIGSVWLWGGLARRERVRREAVVSGACAGCGYDLSGLRAGEQGAVICPECGMTSRGNHSDIGSIAVR